MDNNENYIMLEKNKIKVNKYQSSHNYRNSNLDYNDIQIINEEIPTDNFIKKIILSKIKNKNRHNNFHFEKSKNKKDIDNEVKNILSRSYKNIKLRNNNIIYKNDNIHSLNSKQYAIVMNRNYKNQKRINEEENGSKLLIYKSETQYPLTYRTNDRHLEQYDNMKNIKYNPYNKTQNLKYISVSPRYFDEIIKSQKLICDNRNNFDDSMKYIYRNQIYNDRKENYNFPYDLLPNMTFNNYNKLYQGNINPNTYYYYYDNNHNIYFNDINFGKDKINFITEDISNISKTDRGYTKKDYIKMLKKPNISNINYKKEKIINNNNKDKQLINVYKRKLIKIFVLFMKNFLLKYSKKIYTELICKLRRIKKSDIIKIKNNQKNNYNKYKNLKVDKFHLYLNHNNYEINNNDKQNKSKTLTSHKKNSSVSVYKKINKKIKLNNQLTNNYNKEKEETMKKSLSNLYVPSKTRIINRKYNNNLGPKSKISIFNGIKIDKNSIFNEIYSNNKDLNSHINNFYNTNCNNFYTKKNNSYNKKNIKNQNPKLTLWKIKTEKKNNIGNKIDEPINNLQTRPQFYNKILNKEKKNIKNDNKNNMNIYIKKNENINHKNINKKLIRYTNSFKSKNLFNSTNFDDKKKCNIIKKIDNNINNSVNLSDLNNYCLDDKPMNIIFLKNNNLFHEDNSFSKEDGKNMDNVINDNFAFKQSEDSVQNLIHIKTEDKRLIINCKYLRLNQYKNNNKKKNHKNLIVSKNNSFNIICKNTYNNKIIKNKKNINNQESLKTSKAYSNKYIKIIKIKKYILKIFYLLNNKIKEKKTQFFEKLKHIVLFYKIYNIISPLIKKQLKNHYKIFKINVYKNKIKNIKYNESFKQIIPINNENKKRNNIFIKKQNINLIIDSNNVESDFINPQKIKSLKGKEKLKFLIKQIYKNNNSYDQNCRNNSYENKNIITVWKSNDFQKNNLSIKKNNIYFKKYIRLNSLNNNGDKKD